MEDLTGSSGGLLFNDTMVMIAGEGAGGANNNGFLYSSSPSSSNSSSSSSSSPHESSPSSVEHSPYYHNTIFSETSPADFDFSSPFDDDGVVVAPSSSLLNNNSSGSSDDELAERNYYIEELISSDLSSDEDKFLESIRYGGGGREDAARVLLVDDVGPFNTDLLSEEELVSTIQNYGDVKVVQVEQHQEQGFDGDVFGGGVGLEGVVEDVEMKVSVGSSKKRKSSVGNKQQVKRVTIIQQQPSKKPNNKANDDMLILENNVELLSPASSGSSSSPGSPKQQQQINGSFQELKLSEEEKRLLLKEGISLPTHYPLTKLEERELKRIRRKIRNKISAQDSRKRKKEFLDKLQQRVQEVEEEKSLLQKRVRSLESINTKLNAQVKRLQQALTSAINSPTNTPKPPQNQSIPAATTLLVLILSLALVVLPTGLDKNNPKLESDNEIISLLNRSSSSELMGMIGPQSRSMVGVEADEHVEVDESDDEGKNVMELIGEMKKVLVKMGGRGRGAGMLRGRMMREGGGRKRKVEQDDWWVSDGEEELDNKGFGKRVMMMFGGGGGGERKDGMGGRVMMSRFGKDAFQSEVVDEMDVD